MLSVAQKSIYMDFGGLIRETQIDTENAWSDAKQQITPAQFKIMLEALLWRVTNKEYATELTLLRERIDQVDDELLSLLGRRMKIADEIGKFKKENNLTILQTIRWNQILERAMDKGDSLILSKEFLIKYFDAVHIESINHQIKVMNDSGKKLNNL